MVLTVFSKKILESPTLEKPLALIALNPTISAGEDLRSAELLAGADVGGGMRGSNFKLRFSAGARWEIGYCVSKTRGIRGTWKMYRVVVGLC